MDESLPVPKPRTVQGRSSSGEGENVNKVQDLMDALEIDSAIDECYPLSSRASPSSPGFTISLTTPPSSPSAHSRSPSNFSASSPSPHSVVDVYVSLPSPAVQSLAASSVPSPSQSCPIPDYEGTDESYDLCEHLAVSMAEKQDELTRFLESSSLSLSEDEEDDGPGNLAWLLQTFSKEKLVEQLQLQGMELGPFSLLPGALERFPNLSPAQFRKALRAYSVKVLGDTAVAEHLLELENKYSEEYDLYNTVKQDVEDEQKDETLMEPQEKEEKTLVPTTEEEYDPWVIDAANPRPEQVVRPARCQYAIDSASSAEVCARPSPTANPTPTDTVPQSATVAQKGSALAKAQNKRRKKV